MHKLTKKYKVLNWPGSKWSVSTYICKIMKDHKLYLEPFFGSGAVYFSKDPERTEIINDLDGNVVNLFRVIRDKPESLAYSIEMTPYAKDEYLYCRHEDVSNLSDVEKARRFLVGANMARVGQQNLTPGWKHSGLVRGISRTGMPGLFNQLPNKILNAAERLKYAEIENTDALKLIEKYNHKDVLMYIDPPYMKDVRNQDLYAVEMKNYDEHVKLLNTILESDASIILSGYSSKLYNDTLKDWTRIEVNGRAEFGKHRTEVLWLNYKIDEGGPR